jgi:hypothetical protein
MTDIPQVELRYKVGLFGRERYVLQEKELLVSFDSILRSSEYRLGLAQMDPRQVRHRNLPLGWGLAVVACAVAAIALLVGAFAFAGGRDRLPVALASCLPLFGLVVSAIQFVRHSRNSVIFCNAYSGTGMLALRWQKPDRQTFEAFVRELQERIRRSREQAQEGALASELRGLEKLRNEGVLNEQEYRAAKAKLLGLEPWQLQE